MVKLETKLHGIVSYDEKEVITFKKGIPGFEHLSKFVLFDLSENPEFRVLHSVQDNNIGFIVMNPFILFKDYELKLKNDLIEELNIETEENVIVFNTITINKENVTTNLKAPIIINIKSGFGEQIILDREDYKIKQPLF